MKSQSYQDSQEFKEQVLSGIKEVAQITAQTLGPGGRAIMLEQENGSVVATKDGVTVARHFAKYHSATSKIGDLVAQAAVEASERTGRSCGDGTTSSLVLAHAIVQAGQEWIKQNPGYSPQRLARELKETFANTITPAIQALARPIKDLPPEESEKAVWHVAMVSANFDKSIADAVTKAIKMVGDDGMVVVEEGTGGLDTTVQHQHGFPVLSGLSDLGGSASAAFVNRKSYGDCVLNGAYVVLYDGEINDIESVVPLMEKISSEQQDGMPLRRPVVVVAHGFGDNVLRVFAQNFRRNALSIVPLITPRSGQAHGRQAFLHDLSAYTGGLVFEPQAAPLTGASPANIGFTDEVKIGASNTVFVTDPIEELVQKRIEDLKLQMAGASEWDNDRIRYRIGQLTGGVATVFAGGATALEAKERRDRVVDAVSAVRSAMEMGIVPGGGATLFHVSRGLDKNSLSNIIFEKALKKPFVQILLNAGVASNDQEAMFIGNSVGKTQDGSFMVYDALERKPVEFWASGIFDGAKTVTHALQNALSVAQLLMTTGGAIALDVSDAEHQIKTMQKGMMNALNNGELE